MVGCWFIIIVYLCNQSAILYHTASETYGTRYFTVLLVLSEDDGFDISDAQNGWVV